MIIIVIKLGDFWSNRSKLWLSKKGSVKRHFVYFGTVVNFRLLDFLLDELNRKENWILTDYSAPAFVNLCNFDAQIDFFFVDLSFEVHQTSYPRRPRIFGPNFSDFGQVQAPGVQSWWKLPVFFVMAGKKKC